MAPSVDISHKTPDDTQPLQRPSDDPQNLSAPRPTTSLAQQSKTVTHEKDSIADIIGRLDNIMNFLSNKLIAIIEDKISQTLTQKPNTTNRENNDYYNKTDTEDDYEDHKRSQSVTTVIGRRRDKQTPNQPNTNRGTRKENNSDLEAVEKMA